MCIIFMNASLKAAYKILDHSVLFWKGLIQFSIQMYECIGHLNIYRL